jgi:hypothetical protein
VTMTAEHRPNREPTSAEVVTLTVRCRAVTIPGGDATGQVALDGAAVELSEDLGTHNKSFQSSEGENVLSCSLHEWLGVFGA